jgi:hypothetical protein
MTNKVSIALRCKVIIPGLNCVRVVLLIVRVRCITLHVGQTCTAPRDVSANCSVWHIRCVVFVVYKCLGLLVALKEK